MSSKTAGIVRKLKDLDGRFLWSDGMTQGQPARLMGYPVLVAEDMLGMFERVPRFVKKYEDLAGIIEKTAAKYAEEVRARRFPSEDQTYQPKA